MYQLLIHWDNSQISCIEGQTKEEVFKKLDQMKIDPDKALWELKWIPAKKVVSDSLIKGYFLNNEEI